MFRSLCYHLTVIVINLLLLKPYSVETKWVWKPDDRSPSDTRDGNKGNPITFGDIIGAVKYQKVSFHLLKHEIKSSFLNFESMGQMSLFENKENHLRLSKVVQKYKFCLTMNLGL